MLRTFRRACRTALALLTGESCVLCGRPLVGAGLCGACWLSLPYTHLRGRTANVLERLFWEHPEVQGVSAFLWYKPEFAVSKVVHAIKYGGRQDLALEMGKVMAQELRGTPFFEGIDALLPVPLSAARQRKRGYNQSHALAQGVSQITGIPLLEGGVQRVVDNPSQTSLDPLQRRANVEGIFALAPDVQLQGQHLLIIDDVITVGATLRSMIRTLSAVPDIRLSLLTLCAAGRYHTGAVTPAQLHLPDCSAQLTPERMRRYRPPSR